MTGRLIEGFQQDGIIEIFRRKEIETGLEIALEEGMVESPVVALFLGEELIPVSGEFSGGGGEGPKGKPYAKNGFLARGKCRRLVPSIAGRLFALLIQNSQVGAQQFHILCKPGTAEKAGAGFDFGLAGEAFAFGGAQPASLAVEIVEDAGDLPFQ